MKAAGASMILVVASVGCGAQGAWPDTITSGPLCNETLSLIPGVDEVTPAGFAAADVLKFATGDFATSLLWASPTNVTFGPESGRRALALNVTYTGGQIFHVQSRPREGQTAGCADHVRVGVSVRLRTENGALDETFDADLNAVTSLFVSLRQPLEPNALNGSFEVTQLTPAGGQVKQLEVNAVFSPLGSTGQLTSIVELLHPGPSGTGGAVSATAVTYASWPADAACRTEVGDTPGLPAALGVRVAGFSGEEGLMRFNAASPVSLSWRDGSQALIAINAVSVGDGCVRFASPVAGEAPFQVVFPVTLGTATDDGRIGGQYLGQLNLLSNPSGSLDVISSRVELSLPIDRASDSGFTGVGDVSQYDRLSLSLQSQVKAGAVSGEIVLNGLNVAPCASQPVQRDPSGTGTLPCEGTRFSVLERGIWQSN